MPKVYGNRNFTFTVFFCLNLTFRYYPPNSQYPCVTLIGSPNFGERSVKKDLETQLCIITENDVFRKRLHDECDRLYKLGSPAETERPIPKWVPIFVYLFRSYF